MLTTSQQDPSPADYIQEDEIYDTSEEEVILMTQALILDEPVDSNTSNQAEPQQIFHTEHEIGRNSPGLDIDHWTQIFYNSEAAMRETQEQVLTTSGEHSLGW